MHYYLWVFTINRLEFQFKLLTQDVRCAQLFLESRQLLDLDKRVLYSVERAYEVETVAGYAGALEYGRRYIVDRRYRREKPIITMTAGVGLFGLLGVELLKCYIIRESLQMSQGTVFHASEPVPTT